VKKKMEILMTAVLLLAACVFAKEGAVIVESLRAEENQGKTCIVIDAGHGGIDPGKVGVNGAEEKTLNLQIALRLKALLESEGIEAGRTFFIHHMGNIFIPEITQGGKHRIGRSLSQATQGIFLDVISQFLQLIQVFQRSLALGDLIQDLIHTSCSDTAGRTFSAGFIHSELQEKLGDIHHTVVFIHDDQSAGAHHGADLQQVVVVDGDIHIFCRDASAGRTAGLGSLELLPVGDAAADLFDDGTESCSHGDFHQPGIIDLAAQGEDLGAFGLLCAHGCKPI
jgi:hypothetical protein